MDTSRDERITYAPITDEDEIVSVTFPGNEKAEMLVKDEYDVRILNRKTSRFPDPRILIPQTQNMDVFDDDIFICAYPKCGTHWLWEMCQMLIKGKAEYSSKAKESTMMEFHLPEDYKDIQRPRVFNTHFTPMCLPKKMVDKNCKIVIIQRNPKDVFTSLYHHYAVIGMVVGNSTTFSEYLDYILRNDRKVCSNWFFYTKRWAEFMSSTKQPVLVLKYEDIKMNAIKSLSKLAEFIGYPRDEALLTEIQEKCTVNKMKDVEKTRDSGTFIASGEGISKLYRKGVIGDWKNHFTVAESEHFDALLKTMMKGEDLNFIFE